MKILHVLLTRMPVPPLKYGGTERVLWALYQGQKTLGHEVKFLTKYENNHPDSITFDPNQPLEAQVEGWADIIHFHFLYRGELKTPFVCTTHNQQVTPATFPKNTIFLGELHAKRSGGTAYVHNGLYWADYGEPNLDKPKDYVHFLAKATWRIKNMQRAIKIAKNAKMPMHILGGNRFNLKRNPYFYLSSDLTFHSMVGGETKNQTNYIKKKA